MRKNAARLAAKRPCRGAPPKLRGSYSKLSLAIAAALSGTLTVRVAPVLAADESSSATLEEVVVTARKRTENLQDVPLSIDVYTSKDLQNLAISQFEDYVTMTPSMNFVSAGPGTQTLVMRGVSDGSNPNYAAAATTLFLVDDMSMNYYGVLPDIHWYDLERIEVLNGPQGTTFGAGAMAGAVRFITNKPDPKAFSAGVDLDGGKIDAGGHNGTVEAFVNMPLIADWTALRLSVYDDYHGGFINNLNDTRTWVNGVVSNNSQWAGKNYNTEKVTGARVALGQVIADGWKATLTWSYQRQLTHGAWDEDPSIGGAVNLSGQLVNGPVTPCPRTTSCASDRKASATTPRRWIFMSMETWASATWCSRARIGPRMTAGSTSTRNTCSTCKRAVSRRDISNRSTARMVRITGALPPIRGALTPAAKARISGTPTTTILSAGPTSCACPRNQAALSTG